MKPRRRDRDVSVRPAAQEPDWKALYHDIQMWKQEWSLRDATDEWEPRLARKEARHAQQ